MPHSGSSIQGGEGSAAEVTSALGIEPSAFHEAGEPRSSRDQRPWPNAMWSLDSGLPWDRPLGEHLVELCDAVEPTRGVLVNPAARGYSLDWFCFVEVINGQGGVVLDAHVVARLAGLPVALDLDIYATTESEDNDT